ncbi:Eco29kI family restriction endonuclease [Archangium violaceum]|uniref:Eco29kI family restriction endonuclease n=1 Tax=Archangium violaceum TaxID=83451 RepID=UPI001951E76A|nr:Eco29kI family restriction endonuclease [Archangium violaceum]QRN94564.1 Eco29kI family restriction endonuclease [Archangium violaceum]
MATDFREFDPLDYDNLARTCVQELERRDAVPLDFPKSFPGAGVYALYYKGGFDIYSPISLKDASWPIYVGKAVPKGARKGERTKSATGMSNSLFKRLGEHRESIDAAANLKVKDFLCRYLAVKELWITMAERLLIERYRPVWNVALEGFGLHNPGKGRHEGKLSWWDTLHPGRPWAKHLNKTRTPQEAEALVQDFLKLNRPGVKKRPPLPDDASVFMQDEDVED